MNYLLHCISGSLREKGVIFYHVSDRLEPRGILFGATVFGKCESMPPLARRAMKLFSWRGVFGNADDCETDLRSELEKRFTDVKIELEGCVGLFSCRKP